MINRNNIQEWLLLYADNELSVEDRKAVESFLQENPDMQQELETLLDLRLVPEETENKELIESLYLPLPVLGLEDMSQIIDYSDEELDAKTASRIKEKIHTESSWQEFYRSLQQVKLQPEPTIVFPDKNLLYQQPKTIFFKPSYLMRAAAAMLIIIAGIWLSTQFKKEKPIVQTKNGEELKKESNKVAEVTPVSGFYDSVPKSKRVHNNTITKRENINIPVNQTASSIIPNDTEIIRNKEDKSYGNSQPEVTVVSLNTQTITNSEEQVIVIPHNVITHNVHAIGNNISANREADLIYDVQVSDPAIYQSGAKRIFKQAAITFLRRLNQTIGEEPIRISIIQISHK